MRLRTARSEIPSALAAISTETSSGSGPVPIRSSGPCSGPGWDALIQPYSGHDSRQSLEIYSRLAIGEAQAEYDRAIGRFPV
jgi:hypothetical protein